MSMPSANPPDDKGKTNDEPQPGIDTCPVAGQVVSGSLTAWAPTGAPHAGAARRYSSLRLAIFV